MLTAVDSVTAAGGQGFVGKQFLTICDHLAEAESQWEFPSRPGVSKDYSEQRWKAIIATLSPFLRHVLAGSSKHQRQGLILTGPTPILSDPALTAWFKSWVFTAEPLAAAMGHLPSAQVAAGSASKVQVVPILPSDPVGRERFCLILTAQFSFLAALGKTATGESTCLFSFAPEAIQPIWEILRLRVAVSCSGEDLSKLDHLGKQFAPREPSYRLVMQFSQGLANLISQTSPPLPPESGATPGSADSLLPVPHLSQTCPFSTPEAAPGKADSAAANSLPTSEPDAELLQAIAHEVRTPLTTISTLTRLLLKRSDLPAEAIKRLEAIYRECGEQIDRFSLIFRAVELETQARQPPMHLGPVPLGQVLQQSIPRWQKLAERRSLSLEVSLPPQLPTVVSDPTMLDQVLTGVIGRFSHSLPMGSQIQIQVTLAGDQLKLQVRSQAGASPSQPTQTAKSLRHSMPPMLKSVGQLLMLQPETGNLSLSLSVTKNLFQALGGKLTVRNLPQQGEILTIFLPLGCE